MISFVYDVALLLLGLIALPKLLWQWCASGKYRLSFKQRLGLEVPKQLPDGKVIWIHAVSMGETRAVIPLVEKLKALHPDVIIALSSTTETGHAEAKRTMPQADAHFFLPLDFSWIVRRVMSRIHPQLLILVESDFWFHLLDEAKQQKARVVLVNGKVSERSSKRFAKLAFFTKRLFAHLDHLCLQSSLYQKRFTAMGIDPNKLTVTGNLKFDAHLKSLTASEIISLKEQLRITAHDRIITLGSTHAPEEQLLLSVLDPIWTHLPDLKILLVPRHPERFDSIAQLLKEKNIPFIRHSERHLATGLERVILMDAMGLLVTCYQLSEIAVVGGSFTDHIGGHNVYEPVLVDVPVLFGPHMFNQTDLATLVLEGHAGKQVALSDLSEVIQNWLTCESKRQAYVQACSQLVKQTAGSVDRTLHILSEFL